jgi:nucleoside phosphorylase/tetratricopeptide (TPR) repeat protein
MGSIGGSSTTASPRASSGPCSSSSSTSTTGAATSSVQLSADHLRQGHLTSAYRASVNDVGGTEPTALVVTALALEREAVEHHLQDLRWETHPTGTQFRLGWANLGRCTWRIVLVESGIGNSAAAATTTRALDHFEPSVALFVGIAGGLKDVAIGDVVVATDVLGYEYGKDSDEFLPRGRVAQSSFELVELAKRAKAEDVWHTRANLNGTTPTCVVAPLIAGTKVVASNSSGTAKRIRRHYSQAVAVEMEGLGFLESAFRSPATSRLVIRGISDLIDGKDAADASGSQLVAARNASAFAFEILDLVCQTRSPVGPSASHDTLHPGADRIRDQEPRILYCHSQLQPAIRIETGAFLKQLRGDVENPHIKVLQLIGLSGSGKSTAAQAVAHLQGRYPRVLWFSFNVDPSCENFLTWCHGTLLSSNGTPPTGWDLVRSVRDVLLSTPCLLVLDGTEDLLDENGYLLSELALELFTALTLPRSACGVLVTSRRPIADLQLRAGVSTCTQAPVSLAAAVDYLRESGLAAEQRVLERLAGQLGRHPLSLELFVRSSAVSGSVPSLLSLDEQEEDANAIAASGDILDWYWSRLRPQERAIMVYISLHRTPLGEQGLHEAKLLTNPGRASLERAIRRLHSIQLVELIDSPAGTLLAPHPYVRDYFGARPTDQIMLDMLQRLWAQALERTRSARGPYLTMSDLEPYMDLVHYATALSGRAEARSLPVDEIWRSAADQFAPGRPLGMHLYEWGFVRELRRLYQRVLESMPDTNPPTANLELRAVVLGLLGLVSRKLGLLSDADSAFRSAIEERPNLDRYTYANDDWLGRLWCLRSYTDAYRGQYSRALRVLERGIALDRTNGIASNEALHLAWLGSFHLALGDTRLALQLLTDAVAVANSGKHRDQRQLCHALIRRGDCLAAMWRRGEGGASFEDALEVLEEGLTVARESSRLQVDLEVDALRGMLEHRMARAEGQWTSPTESEAIVALSMEISGAIERSREVGNRYVEFELRITGQKCARLLRDAQWASELALPPGTHEFMVLQGRSDLEQAQFAWRSGDLEAAHRRLMSAEACLRDCDHALARDELEAMDALLNESRHG